METQYVMATANGTLALNIDYVAEQMAKGQATLARAGDDADAAKAARQAAEAECQRADTEATGIAERTAEEHRRRLLAQRAKMEAACKKDELKANAMKVHEFLKSHGFEGGVNAKKRSMLKSRYPLHIAVKAQDAEMVKLLLLAGADKSLKDSTGYTPAQKAEQYSRHKKSSLDVLRELL